MRLSARPHRPLALVLFTAGLLALAASAARAADTYEVTAGDTLSGIAARFDTTVTRLELLNRLPSNAVLVAGKTIELPRPPLRTVVYRVQPGDSLSAIAARYDTTPAAIAAASDISLANPIVIGATLHVPALHLPTSHPAPRVPLTTYRVQPDDSLSAIAARYDTTPAAIAAASDISLANPIVIGATLHVPALHLPTSHPAPRVPLTYRVQPGDSLSAIAARYDTTPAAIAAASSISLANPIVIGATLHVPALHLPSAHTKARTATSHPAPRIPLTTYRVQPGDSLSAIAARYDTTPAAIAAASDISLANPIVIGATLHVPALHLPTSHPAPRVPLTTYRVQPGDSLSAIAARYDTTPAAIAAASSISLANPIVIGATLHVPALHLPSAHTKARTATRHPAPRIPLTTYRVQPGDSLSAIAARTGVSPGELADLNGLNLNGLLLVGTRLRVPRGKLAVAGGVALSGVRGSIAFWAAHYGVSPHLATALAWMESGFNNTLISPAGAVGIMQITPQTWSYVDQVLLLGARIPHTPDGNVRIGVAYLHHLLRLFRGDPHRALAAYYQGARSVQVDGLLPGTARYVADILALAQRF